MSAKVEIEECVTALYVPSVLDFLSQRVHQYAHLVSALVLTDNYPARQDSKTVQSELNFQLISLNVLR